MKNKRIISVFLSAILLLSLAACNFGSEKPKEVLDTMVEDVKQAPCVKFETKGNAKTEKDAEKISFLISGSANSDSSGAQMDISVALGEKTYDVTDVIYTKDKTLYLNINKVVHFLNEKEISSILTEYKDKETTDEDAESSILGSFDISAYMAILASLDLPEYIALPMEESADDKPDSGLDVTGTVTEKITDYKFILEMVKEIYDTLVEDKSVFACSNGIVTVTINKDALNKAADVYVEYAMRNSENLYNVLSKFVTSYSEDSIDKIYEELSKVIRVKRNEPSEDSLMTVADDFEQYVTENKEKIKMLTDFTDEVTIQFKTVLAEETKKNISGEFKDTITVKIDTENKYRITASSSAQGSDTEILDVSVIPQNETINYSAPKNYKNITELLSGMFGDMSLDSEIEF